LRRRIIGAGEEVVVCVFIALIIAASLSLGAPPRKQTSSSPVATGAENLQPRQTRFSTRVAAKDKPLLAALCLN
jgi:hypothetical protein